MYDLCICNWTPGHAGSKKPEIYLIWQRYNIKCAKKKWPLLDHPLTFKKFYYLVIHGIYLIKLKLSGITCKEIQLLVFYYLFYCKQDIFIVIENYFKNLCVSLVYEMHEIFFERWINHGTNNRVVPLDNFRIVLLL